MPSLPPAHLERAKKLRAKFAGPLVTKGPAEIWFATVTAVTTGPPKTVTVQQGTLTAITVRYTGAFTPTVGDDVWGWKVGKDYCVVDTIA